MPFFRLRRREKKTEESLKRTKQGFFRRIVGVFNTPKIDEEFWENLEETLISADVGVKTSTRISETLRERVKSERLGNPDDIRVALREEMAAILSKASGDREFLSSVNGGPGVVLVVGVNGGGKTTSIGKMAHAYCSEGQSVVLAAADTFRAAAIEQLEVWGERSGAHVVAHRQGSDPGAVAFDALSSAKNRKADLVLVDTAGRLHTKYNLMQELQKIKRVVSRFDPSAPHEVVLVLDAVIGQNAVAQARQFIESAGVTGIFLAKLDGSAKGGVVLSICDELGIPIRFIGTGEGPDDMAPFDAEEFVSALLG